MALKKALQTDLKVTKGGGKVVLDLHVPAPAAACQYDVEALAVRVTLGKGAADGSLSIAEREGVQHVSFELPNSTELPGKLRAAIARELERRWRCEALQAGQSGSACGTTCLATTLVKCQSTSTHSLANLNKRCTAPTFLRNWKTPLTSPALQAGAARCVCSSCMRRHAHLLWSW